MSELLGVENQARLTVACQGLGTLLRGMERALDEGKQPGSDLLLRASFQRVIKETAEVVGMLETLREANRAGRVGEEMWGEVDRVLGHVNNVSSGTGDVLVVVLEEPGNAAHTHWRYACGWCVSKGYVSSWGPTAHESMEAALEAAKGHVAAGHVPTADVLVYVGRVNGRVGLSNAPYGGFCGACNRVVVEGVDVADEVDRLLEVHRWKFHREVDNVVLVVLGMRASTARPVVPRRLGDALHRAKVVARFTVPSGDVPWVVGEGVWAK